MLVKAAQTTARRAGFWAGSDYEVTHSWPLVSQQQLLLDVDGGDEINRGVTVHTHTHTSIHFN